MIAKLPLPEFMKEGLKENNTAEVYKYLSVDTFGGYLADYLATAITNGISFLISYIIAVIVLKIIVCALDLVTHLPVIRGVNRLAGLLLGIVKGVIFIWIGLLMITVFCNTQIGAECLRMIEKDTLLGFLYDQNIFVKIFMSIFYSA